MRYIDIIHHLKESYEDNVKRVLRDIMVFLKINQVDTITPEQIASGFADRGMNISVDEVLNLLQNDPMIASATPELVTFKKEGEDEENQDLDTSKPVDNAEEVSKLSKKAVNKSMSDRRIK